MTWRAFGNKSNTRRNDLITPKGAMDTTFVHGQAQKENQAHAGAGDIHLSGYCCFTGGYRYYSLVPKLITPLFERRFPSNYPHQQLLLPKPGNHTRLSGLNPAYDRLPTSATIILKGPSFYC